MDIDDLEHNTRDGLHLAALAGSWIALVQGFGGMRYRPGQPPCFAPRLPPALTRLTFTVMLRGRHLRVEVGPASVTYIVDGDGPPLQITHHGTPVSVAPGQPETRDIPAAARPAAAVPAPRPGPRAPRARGAKARTRLSLPSSEHPQTSSPAVPLAGGTFRTLCTAISVLFRSWTGRLREGYRQQRY